MHEHRRTLWPPRSMHRTAAYEPCSGGSSAIMPDGMAVVVQSYIADTRYLFTTAPFGALLFCLCARARRSSGQESARLLALILAQPCQRTAERTDSGCGDPTPEIS